MQKVICIIGPESTGKSELAKYLAEKLHTTWVPEFARAYLTEKPGKYTLEDLNKIAKGQEQSREDAQSKDNPWVILDTDLEVIKVWSEHAFGTCEEWIMQAIAGFKPDLYLLTAIDLPWQDDPLREHPLPEQRQYFFEIYKDIVVSKGVAFGIVSGLGQERFDKAWQCIQQAFPEMKMPKH